MLSWPMGTASSNFAKVTQKPYRKNKIRLDLEDRRGGGAILGVAYLGGSVTLFVGWDRILDLGGGGGEEDGEGIHLSYWVGGWDE